DEDRGEFVELYNAGTAPVDLAGLYLGDGDALDELVAFSGGPTTVAAGAYAVILDPEYLGGYDIPAGTIVVATANTTLGSGLSTNDPVTLFGDAGFTTLATYGHPFDPGNGVSVERVDLAGDDVETNWRASPCLQSAGRPNCAPLTLAAGLIISEVMSNPADEATGEFIELYNGTDTPVDVAGMIVSDGDSTDAVVAWAGGSTVVPGTTYAVILDPDFPPASVPLLIEPSAVLLTVGGSTLGSGLAVDDPVTILDGTGAVVDSYTRTLAVSDGRSVEKVSLSLGDVLGNWAQSSCPTGSSPGRLNCVSSASAGPRKPLVISEVMANPLDEDTGEFLELYNRGIAPVDAEGLILGDGDAVDGLTGYAGGSTLIPAGGYALILDAEYAGEYAIAPGTTLLSTHDTTLGSSLALDDPIRLYEANGVEVIDSFRSPFNPGNGRSAERIDLRAFDSAANWTASTCASGSSPGADNCAAAAGGLPKQLRITEVLSNQAGTETGGAGEFVELLNIGDRAVDLAGMSLESGTDLLSPARDGIVARGGGPTVLVPGAFAVVLDADYDGRYAFPNGTVVVTIDDANFGSSGLATTHLVQLVDADGITLLDRFGFPSDPGDGVSLHRISLRVVDSAANWAPSSCGAGPGALDCPGASTAASYVSFWADRYGDEAGIYWYQAIGYPDWHDPFCELNVVCDGTLNSHHYRPNFPAAHPFAFQNPYRSHGVVFVERSSPTDDCGGMSGTCTAARFTVPPGALATVPASSRGWYFARTDGPTLNVLDWFGGDPALYWAIPPDGILAPFLVEVTP
ncbi:MAG: lamin tail domain-containing protein, partial [Deltaproteobacteria bacterium]|nr:lamin tail domain-containing protein [Deltaproteobacteria bacterium]